MSDPAMDRRPIAARRLRATVVAAEYLVRHRASPNAISVAGMVCAVFGGLAFAAAPAHPLLWLLGAALVQARLAANMLDGMVALGRAVASPLGEVFNEVPDRVSDTAVLVGVGVAAGLPWLGLAAALAAIATAYVRVVGKAAGLTSDYCGPMAKQHRMAVVTALAVWCAFAPGAIAAPTPAFALYGIAALAVFTAGRRLVRVMRALGNVAA